MLNQSNFTVLPEYRKALPFSKIRSRLPTAIILSLYGRKIKVIRVMLTVSKSSHAFIVTQDFLKGFLLNSHCNSASWFYEYELSAKYRRTMSCCLLDRDLKDLSSQLAYIQLPSEKEELLRNVCPSVYLVYLRSLGRIEEADELYDGTPTSENFTWYTHAELLPTLRKLRSE